METRGCGADKLTFQLLNFSGLAEWHKGFIRSLAVHEDSKSPDTLVPGDKVDANIEGQKFTAEVKVSAYRAKKTPWQEAMQTNFTGSNAYFRPVGKF